MITCRELIDFLDSYIADELSPAQRRAVDEHLAVCPDCVNYLESYRQTISFSRALVFDGSALASGIPEGLVRAILAARLADN